MYQREFRFLEADDCGHNIWNNYGLLATGCHPATDLRFYAIEKKLPKSSTT